MDLPAPVNEPFLHAIIALSSWFAERGDRKDLPVPTIEEAQAFAAELASKGKFDEFHTRLLRLIAKHNAKFADRIRKVFTSLDNPEGEMLQGDDYSDTVDARLAALNRVQGTPHEQVLIDSWKPRRSIDDMAKEVREREIAWLAARERGEPGPTIPAAVAEGYEKLEELLKEMQMGVEPKPDWQESVLADIDNDK